MANAKGSCIYFSGTLRRYNEHRPKTKGKFSALLTTTIITSHDNTSIPATFNTTPTLLTQRRNPVPRSLKKGLRLATLISVSDFFSFPQAQRPWSSAPPSPRSSHPSGGRGMGDPITSRQNSISIPRIHLSSLNRCVCNRYAPMCVGKRSTRALLSLGFPIVLVLSISLLSEEDSILRFSDGNRIKEKRSSRLFSITIEPAALEACILETIKLSDG
mmetsp:Transcript_11734/g.21351  ORF Transcript_11734/g.21351 Transcript_11734/m.21351 type:complete len:216 (-) Transcript_11734:2728-3375(-)